MREAKCSCGDLLQIPSLQEISFGAEQGPGTKGVPFVKKSMSLFCICSCIALLLEQLPSLASGGSELIDGSVIMWKIW